ncbi:hypothetical protein [Williamsia herbipolensis]|uniref:hypothetical protein n=1 Tax=Williamsia herbipolensis TaxID=1603258 RepID=UPI000AAD6018|nr:hypothetical protein [Williamsia herbipolensis]
MSQHRMTRTTAGVVLAAAITAATAGQALAAPPGSAPPTTDTAPGSAPAPAPAPIPPGPSIIPAPTYDAPVVYENSPGYVEPTYRGSYNPVPPALRAPRRVAPVAPVLPNQLRHPGVIKLGNLHFAQGVISDADAHNINGQAATIEARTATYYESIGFPKDQAARTAASTTVGILAGGAAGAVALGIPAAVAGAIVGLPVGAGVGAATGAIVGAVGGTPLSPVGSAAGAAALAGPGALIGLAAGPVVGALAGGAGGAALGALGGAALGGIIGYAVGAGDPGGNPNAPLGGATNEAPILSKPAPPNPEANQYELHLDRANLPGNGKVDYVVNKSGDVSGEINVGPIKAPIAISHQQADAPFQAAGALAQTARDAVAQGVADFGRQAQKAFPGLKITYPQLAPAPAAGKHRK